MLTRAESHTAEGDREDRGDRDELMPDMTSRAEKTGARDVGKERSVIVILIVNWFLTLILFSDGRTGNLSRI